jgi:hypothetical protein
MQSLSYDRANARSGRASDSTDQCQPVGPRSRADLQCEAGNRVT